MVPLATLKFCTTGHSDLFTKSLFTLSNKYIARRGTFSPETISLLSDIKNSNCSCEGQVPAQAPNPMVIRTTSKVLKGLASQPNLFKSQKGFLKARLTAE